MPTDDERREVARRMRDYVDLPDDWWQETRAEFYVEKCVFGDVNRHREGELFARLADLIEPNRGSGGKTILCSHCESASFCGCEPGDEEGGCDFEPSVTEGEPPYNLYSLYEAVLRRHPRDEYAIEDDEVEELVDALLDICNAPGHEHIQRLKPPYPDATASYKGWSAEVYDPDGVLASPSNVAGDLVRSHADPTEPSEPKVKCVAEVKVDGERLEKLVHDAAVELTGIDRDALLAVAETLEDCAGRGSDLTALGYSCLAKRIREALGVSDG